MKLYEIRFLYEIHFLYDIRLCTKSVVFFSFEFFIWSQKVWNYPESPAPKSQFFNFLKEKSSTPAAGVGRSRFQNVGGPGPG